ncbi:metallophosphoesterase family protein [Deinococcus cellulosilyticus]|uniref:Calcineurin-like phosphoesterase domain-containing protein n=1 Tax=Deinococcus cellulosilyticus (strain DSM 18568 / NBRC 106333 / KACC 11606 / 5516J-15) TaxID=1223518 RepID=A0A511N7Y1_DEIC1|nr:metallophosphoesterase [Deinococcus cellulosilyticus]GEM48531.1 hypothetical protein DC3_41660 [Deinococcus cellulosilyticus NBRC 106333 = KACC 11606]
MAQNRPIVTVRDARASLWQSAVAQYVRGQTQQNAASNSAENAAPSTSSPVYNHPMVRAASAHVMAQTTGQALPRITYQDAMNTIQQEAGKIDPTDIHLSDMALQLAEAIRNGNDAQAKTLDTEIRKYSTKDYAGWLTCVTTYLSYYQGGTLNPMYRSWQVEGQNNLNYGVIDYQLPNNARIALLGDWGTGMDDAYHLLLTLLQQHNPDVIIHLGDIYYSGTPEECTANFENIFNQAFAVTGKRLPVFTIPGNHDYYARGEGFYPMLDSINNPQKYSGADASWQQQASFFCLRTQDGLWQFLGMDTGYQDHNPIEELLVVTPSLQPDEIVWHQDKLKNFSGKTVLLSHHQLYSSNSTVAHGNTPYLNNYLLSIFQPYFAQNVAAWFWGHEHNMVLYKPGLFGLTTGRLVGASAYEETVAEDPYKVNYPNIPYLDPTQYQLGSSNGYFNHSYAIFDLTRTNPDDPISVAYYQYPSWGGTMTNPPTTADFMYQESLQTQSLPVGDVVNFNDLVVFQGQGGVSITAADEEQLIVTSEYYPHVDDQNPAMPLRIIGNPGQLTDGSVVQIQTGEALVGQYNLLGAWSTPSLYYYKAGYQNENWTIHLLTGNAGDPIHYGQQVYFVNSQYQGQQLMRSGQTTYLTTATSEYVWTLSPASPATGNPLTFGAQFKLRTVDSMYISTMTEEHLGFTSQYFPHIGSSGSAVNLVFTGGSGQLTSGQSVQLQTTESAVGSYNLLGAWSTPSLYYYKSGYPNQNWTVVKLKRGPSDDDTIRYGDQIAIVNQSYVGQAIVPSQSGSTWYLTTISSPGFYWIIEN